ncbi:MAG TPA: reverse transcriptase [Syntrophomonas sp.]|jgi:retron-type reverse transcriptase|nr:reverse transcriptase [Syntrophomonas sp.]
METKLARIAEIAKQRPKEEFTSLYHLMNPMMLKECHCQLAGNKSAGIDGVTKREYSADLDSNIEGLVQRLRTHSYKPKPAKRTYIPKAGGKEMRPLGIPAHEDKIVQMGLSKILTAIYEQDFLPVSYGFRPGRGCHDALRELNKTIVEGKINYVVDADIKGFFNNINHEWMNKFVALRIISASLSLFIGFNK